MRVANTQSVGDTVKVNEQSRVNMTCAVDANPPIQGVREWTKGAVAVYQVRRVAGVWSFAQEKQFLSTRFGSTLVVSVYPSGPPPLSNKQKGISIHKKHLPTPRNPVSVD